MTSYKTSVVSDAPLVSIVYFLDDAGSMTKSICLPASSATTAGLKACSLSGDFFSGGYHLRTHFLSAADSVPGGNRPSVSYRLGSAMRPGSNSYSMIDFGSHFDPCTCSSESFCRMLSNVSLRVHSLGGALRFL